MTTKPTWSRRLALPLWLLLVAALLWSAPAFAQEPVEPPLKSDLPALLAETGPGVAATQVLTDGAVLLPLVFDEQAFPPGKVSFVPVITNGTFDLGSEAGWTWIENGASFPLIYPTTPLYASGGLPPAATRAYLAWMGGGFNLDDRLSQSIQLPADYFVRLRFDYFTTSAEPTCNPNPLDNDDTAALYVNNILAPPAFALCRDGASTGWTERTLDLSAFRGQKVTIEFRLKTDGNFNSNLYLDNIELCGLSGDLSLPQQCALAGWQETTAGSASSSLSLGGVSRSAGISSMPALAISSQGRPFLAWSDQSQGNAEIYIRRWDGLLWQEMGGVSARGGGISNNGGESTEPSVGTAPNQAAYVAWQDSSSGNSDIYVKWWNGTNWAEVGPGSASGGGISANGTLSRKPSVAVASNGTPYVAWSDQRAGVGEIFVKRWNGAFWEEVGPGSATGGGISNNAGESTDPVIAAGVNGTIFVAWSDDSEGDSEIYMRQYRDGEGWRDVGTGSSVGGGISGNNAASYSPALAVGPSGLPYVAWVDESDDNDTEIYARRFTGSSWENMGSNSASGGGISNNRAPSQEPSIAVDRFNRAIVAWSDLSSGPSEIYLKRWNGSGWEDVGGSSGGTGVSNTGVFNYEPSAAVGPDGTPYVAWSAVAANVEIYVRRFMMD
jgi:hypothetical protein